MRSPDYSARQPRLHSSGRRLAAAILAPTIALATVGAITYERDQSSKARQERLVQAHDNARLTIGAHHFQDPKLEEITNISEPGKARSEVKLTLRLPENPAAKEALKEYAASNAVTWFVGSSIASRVITEGLDGKYEVTKKGVLPYNEQLSIQGDTGTAIVSPLGGHAVGTEVALYVVDNATTDDDNKSITTEGEQYVGAMVLEDNGWAAMPKQPALPDIVNATSAPTYG